MQDFSNLLNVKAEDVKAPVPLPAGEAMLVVQSYEFGESSEKKTPYVEFTFGIQSYLNALGELPEKLTSRTIRETFYLTEDALFRLKTFIEATGVQATGRTLNEALPDTKGQSVVATLIKVPDRNNPERVFTNIKNFAKA